MTIEVIPIPGMDEVRPGDDLPALVADAIEAARCGLVEGDVVVVTHKVVSKAEGAVAVLEDDGPDAHRQLVDQEAVAVLRRRGELVIAETRHGFVCANAGVDRSNAAPGTAVLLPRDPDRSAHRLRLRLQRRFGVELAVLVTDTFGRAWRRGLTDVAVGVSGMLPIADLRGSTDSFGRTLEVTEVAVADEIAAAADLVMGKARGIPVAVVRGVDYPRGEGRVSDLLRPVEEDLFR